MIDKTIIVMPNASECDIEAFCEELKDNKEPFLLTNSMIEGVYIIKDSKMFQIVNDIREVKDK